MSVIVPEIDIMASSVSLKWWSDGFRFSFWYLLVVNPSVLKVKGSVFWFDEDGTSLSKILDLQFCAVAVSFWHFCVDRPG